MNKLVDAMRKYPLEVAAMAVVVPVLWYMDPNNSANYPIGVLALLVCCVIGFGRNIVLLQDHQDELELQADMVAVPEGVDIWSYQEHLMNISGQRVASRPSINKTMLLYASMQGEELAEEYKALACALGAALATEYAATPKGTAPPNHTLVLEAVRTKLEVASSELDHAYKYIKAQLATMGDGISYPIPKTFAIPVLDGVTDVAVVTAGFSLAAGLPGPEAYVDVVSSNISKANPDTGLIERDDSGKWIKGREYKEPSLATVLEQAGVKG